MLSDHQHILQKYFASGEKLGYKDNEIIIGRRETYPSVYYIEKGFVGFFSDDKHTNRKLLAILKPEEIFSLVWTITNLKGPFICCSLNSITLYRLPSDRFLQLMEKNHNFCLAVSYKLAMLNYIYSWRMYNLEVQNFYKRLVVRLLFLAQRFGEKRGNTVIIRVPLTQEHLAQSISSTRETVTRGLKVLSDKGLVSYKKNLITILDLQNLKKEIV